MSQRSVRGGRIPKLSFDRLVIGARTEHARALRELASEAKSRPCMDCGIQYPPYVMQFDHREPFQKRFNISSAHHLMLLKCDVVCANCHAERTHHQAKRRRAVQIAVEQSRKTQR